MKLYSIVNENLAILCGIGLIVVQVLGLDQRSLAENVNKLKARYPGWRIPRVLFRK